MLMSYQTRRSPSRQCFLRESGEASGTHLIYVRLSTEGVQPSSVCQPRFQESRSGAIRRIATLLDWANSIGIDASVTPLHLPGDSAVNATSGPTLRATGVESVARMASSSHASTLLLERRGSPRRGGTGPAGISFARLLERSLPMM